MSEQCRNIYKIARKAAGFTQESSAERIGISPESIRAYETGQRTPPNDIVAQMVICYNAQHLAYQHLQESNELMNQIVSELEERDILQTSVRIYNRLKRFSEKGTIDRLMEIAEDGIISDDERPKFNDIMRELQEIIKSGLELSVFCDKTNKE